MIGYDSVIRQYAHNVSLRINKVIITNVKILYGEDDKILYGWEQIFKKIMADQSIISTNKQKK